MIHCSDFIFERGQHGSFFHLTGNRAPYLWAHISERMLSKGFKSKIATTGDTERKAETLLILVIIFPVFSSDVLKQGK